MENLFAYASHEFNEVSYLHIKVDNHWINRSARLATRTDLHRRFLVKHGEKLWNAQKMGNQEVSINPLNQVDQDDYNDTTN